MKLTIRKKKMNFLWLPNLQGRTKCVHCCIWLNFQGLQFGVQDLTEDEFSLVRTFAHNLVRAFQRLD